MKNTLKLSLAFAATLITSSAFAEGDHHGEMKDGMAAQEGHMGMMDGNMIHGGMKMDKSKKEMMIERSSMMSKCADEIEKDSPNSAQLKLCEKMIRKQVDMMNSCMEKGCSMMMKDKKSHHDTDKK